MMKRRFKILQYPVREYYRRMILRLTGYQKNPMRTLVIDPTNFCTMKCPICGAAQGLDDSSRGYMKWETFMKIAEQAKMIRPMRICLYAHGEPLMHEKLLDMVSVLSGYGLPTQIVTNAELLTPEYSSKLVDAGLNELVISYPGVSDLNYRICRGRNIPAGLEKQISDVIDVWERSGQTLSIRTLIIKDDRITKEDVNSFKKKWKAKKGVESIETHGYLPWPRLCCEELLSQINDHPKRCNFGSDSLCVLWNGVITPCSYDVFGELALGSVADTSLAGVFNGKPLRMMRRMWYRKKNQWPMLCRSCLIPFCHVSTSARQYPVKRKLR